MRYRMLAIDLDGTLLDSHGRISEAHRRAVERARQAGLLVVLCTGRGLQEARAQLDTLRHEGPVVLAGGALVTDPTTGRSLHSATIEPGLARQIVGELRSHGHAALVLLDPDPEDHDYLVVGPHALTDNTRWWFDQIGARLRFAEEPSEADLHHALRVGIVADAANMPGMEQQLVETFSDRVFVQHFLAIQEAVSGRSWHVLEVFARGVNKWSGLRWLARQHGVPLEAVAAVGDQINDLTMIESAGCGIAMANAVAPVHRAADRATESNDEHGVATAIDRLLAGRW